MNHLERVRDVLPVLAALYAMAVIAHGHAASRPALPIGPGFDSERVVAGLKWHMLEMGRNEHDQALLFPGN